MSSTRLSAIVITHNEASTIERCLRSLSFADEKIVVDAESTDATRSIAQRLGAQVLTRPWSGFGDQKNVGRDKASGDWLLFIDADEEVTPALQDAITQALDTATVDFLWLRIVTVFLGKPLWHLYGHNPRLFKKSAGKWTSDAVHEQVETLSGQRLRLNDRLSAVISQPLLHHSHETIRSYINQMHQYTTLDAQQMAKANEHRSSRPVRPTIWLPYQLSCRQFVKMFLYKRGFLDGYAGFTWCVLSAYYEYEMAVKYKKLTLPA